jgi:hypothetical protein
MREMAVTTQWMRVWLPALVLVLAPGFGAPTKPGLSAAVAPTLPAVISYSLDKVKVTLPADLAGRQNVLVLYFQPDQSAAAIAWSGALRPLKAAHADLQCYLLPVYSRENFLYRWWIEAALRSGAPAAEDWSSTIPLFVDKIAFLHALGIGNERQAVLLLTDKAGRVEWRTEGPFDEAKLSALTAAVGSVLLATQARFQNRADGR